jgi:hypothetical protein
MDDLERRAVVLAELVSIVESGECFCEHTQTHGEGKSSIVVEASKNVAERLPVEKLHRQEVPFAFDAGFERLDDVRMIQLRRHLGFGKEHLHEFFVLRELTSQFLQHDELLEDADSAGERDVNRAHAPLPEACEQPVPAQRAQLFRLVRQVRCGAHRPSRAVMGKTPAT